MLLRVLALLAPLLEVEWSAPSECPPEEVFIERVGAEADQELNAAEGPVLRASVLIEELPEQRWRLTLVMLDDPASGRRQFAADTCDEVVEAAVIVVAVRVVELISETTGVPTPPSGQVPEPDAVVAETPTTTGRDPIVGSIDTELGVAGEAARTAEEPALRPRPRRTPSRVGGWLALQGGVALGVLPGVGGAIGVEGGVRGRWWRAGLAVHGAPLRRRNHPEDAEVGGRFDLVSVDALGCGVPEAGPVVFPLCGRVTLGALRGIGFGRVDDPRPRTTLWSGIGGSLGVGWRVTRFVAPFVSAQLLATLRGTSFSVGTVPGAVHDTGSVAFRAWAGLEFHL